MKKLTQYVVRIIFFVFALSSLFIKSAHAYLDPGTGSLILQGLIAGLAVALFVGKVYWRRLLAFFGLRKGKRADKIDEGKA